MKFLLFGTGDYYRRYRKWFDKSEIVALIDNDEKKKGTIIDGSIVVNPKEINQYQYDYIVVLSFYIKDMKKQLINEGVAKEKILHFFELYKLKMIEKKFFPIECYGSDMNAILENKKNTVLLLSTDLEIQGGPANVLIRMAKVMKKNGIHVVFGTMQDGKQKDKLIDLQIPVIVDPRLQIGTMKEIEWTHGFKHIVCNTIGYGVFLFERDIDTKITWWLHDSKFFYDGIEKNKLINMDYTNLKIVSVGEVPKQAFLSIVPNATIGELLYGIYDEKEDYLVKFLVLGYIEKRKGQDLLLQAINSLSHDDRKNAIFYFAGNDTSLLARELKKEATTMSNVIFTGILSDFEKKLLLQNIDVLICSSREDPMPAVVAEAMMNGKTTIVSDSSGISKYIENKISGLIFKNEDIDSLSNAIAWCVKNYEMLPIVGEKSRDVYIKKFSIESFERNVMNLIGGELVNE